MPTFKLKCQNPLVQQHKPLLMVLGINDNYKIQERILLLRETAFEILTYFKSNLILG